MVRRAFLGTCQVLVLMLGMKTRSEGRGVHAMTHYILSGDMLYTPVQLTTVALRNPITEEGWPSKTWQVQRKGLVLVLFIFSSG